MRNEEEFQIKCKEIMKRYFVYILHLRKIDKGLHATRLAKSDLFEIMHHESYHTFILMLDQKTSMLYHDVI